MNWTACGKIKDVHWNLDHWFGTKAESSAQAKAKRIQIRGGRGKAKAIQKRPNRCVPAEHLFLGGVGWVHPAAPAADYRPNNVLDRSLPRRVSYHCRLVERCDGRGNVCGLAELANSLNAELKRAAEEGLSDDELALFDLLRKENISNSDGEKVKRASRGFLYPLWNSSSPCLTGRKTCPPRRKSRFSSSTSCSSPCQHRPTRQSNWNQGLVRSATTCGCAARPEMSPGPG